MLTPPRLLDLRGLACPLPVLRARKALIPLPNGALVEVLATDPMAAIDIPHFCNESGHRVVESSEADGVLRFVIERGDGAGGART